MTTTFESGPGRLFIGGQWLDATDGARADVIDPSTGQVVTTVAEAGAADVDAAVRAAREAFDSGTWSGLSGRERGRILHRVAELIGRTPMRSRPWRAVTWASPSPWPTPST